ncbi:hypothetical protein R6Q59_020992 [Mikania micrantha]
MKLPHKVDFDKVKKGCLELWMDVRVDNCTLGFGDGGLFEVAYLNKTNEAVPRWYPGFFQMGRLRFETLPQQKKGLRGQGLFQVGFPLSSWDGCWGSWRSR